jgi:uncharacterized damage-inducible protein DinB
MIEYHRKILVFDHWANSELAGKLASLNEPPEQAVKIMSHIFAAHWLWLGRIAAAGEQIAVWPEIEVSQYRDHGDRILASWKTYLDNVSSTDLELSVTYTNTKGKEFINTPGDIMGHVAQHSAYHRGQVNRILRQSGHEPPYVDYIHYVRSVLNSG